MMMKTTLRMQTAAKTASLGAAALAMLVVSAPTLLAHEGHEHKALGTVTAIGEKAIGVKTQDGKAIDFALTPETTFKAGDAQAARADVTVGSRVVVVYEEENGQKRAKEVLLPAKGKMGGAHSQ